jgi:hypothetical protein
VSLLRAFLAHEATTQLRSTRFRVMSAVYVLVSSAPAVAVFVMARRAPYTIGSATYAALLDLFQPFLTMLFVAIIAVDAVIREREEGSFAVVSLAPLTAAGYLGRRWIAVMAVALPVTLLPRIVGVALAVAARQQMPLLAAFAGGWLLRVVPVVVIGSALALALGTINGNTILAIIVGFLLLTVGLGEINDLLAYAHRRFDPGVELAAPNMRKLQELSWSLRGYFQPQLPSESGYPLAAEVDEMLPRTALMLGLSALLLGVASVYLRRTRRDLRPWAVRPDHPLRSFIRLFNRIRDEYSPDGSIGAPERLAVAGGVLLLAGSFVFLDQRTRRFERLGAERYAAYTRRDPLPMSEKVVPAAVKVRGALDSDGRVRARAAVTLRNDGSGPVSHLGFALNPLVHVRGMRAASGHARMQRLWQRIGVDVEPPLAAGESRTVVFDVDGAPGSVSIAIPWGGGWRVKWRHYVTATKSFELTDLSHSTIRRDVDETRANLEPGDLFPVPRYSPWIIDEDTDQFVRETIEPVATMDVVLEQPFAAMADSCGRLAVHGGRLESRCSLAPGAYRLAGGPLSAMVIAPEVSLVYIPAHEALARVHGPSLAAGVARAESAWSGLALPRPIVYLEQPGSIRDPTFYEWREMRRIGGSGTLQTIPETMFGRYQPIDGAVAAASLVINSLRTRRPVVSAESDFFVRFYEATVGRRLSSGRASSAVVASTGSPTVRTSLLAQNGMERMRFVTAAVEARAGAAHVVDGINDFVAAGPRPGTARELFAAIGRRAGIDLTRMYEDYVAADKAPRLTLENVAFRRSGSGWEVRGTLHNDGTGEALCPIALRTAGGSLWQTLRVDSGERVSFVFNTPTAPHTLQLDPDRVCYREAFVGSIENVDTGDPRGSS